jgi:uncharacterized protein (DUF4415 family)
MGAWSIGWPARSALCDFWRQPVAVVVYTEDDGRDLIESSRYERQPDMSVTASKRPSATDWERLATMQDADIDRSQIEELDKGFFENATLRLPAAKKAVFLRIDSDVLEWYRSQGPGYQTRMNAVLRMFMQAKTGQARRSPRRRTGSTSGTTPKPGSRAGRRRRS